MKRAITILVTFILLLGSFSSCSKHLTKENGTVPDDVTFFESATYEFGSEYVSEDEETYLYTEPVYYADGCIYVETYVNEYVYLDTYDYQGNRLLHLDTTCLSSGPNYTLSTVIFGDDENTFLIVAEVDYASCLAINTLYLLGENGEKLTKVADIDISALGDSASITNAFLVDEEVFVTCEWLEGSIFKDGIAVINTNGECLYSTTIDFGIFQIGRQSNGSIILCERIEDDVNYFQFIMDGYRIENISINEDIYQEFKYSNLRNDGRLYVQKGTRILRYDFITKEVTEYLDYNYCSADMVAIGSYFIDYVDDNVMLLLKLEQEGTCEVIRLSKTDSNPYVGRTIIDVVEIWGIDNPLTDAVAMFNSNNEEYFAYVSDRYDINVINIPDMYIDITSISGLTVSQTYITNQLMQDIRNGIGPDVIYGLGDVTQINSDEYLVDLSSYMDGANGIKREEYFQNAFKAYSTGGKQYQIPLSIHMNGVMTNKDNAPTNGKGYTYDEYSDYVDKEFNGIDPISHALNSKTDIFNYYFEAVKDEFIVGTSDINISNDRFIELAEFVNKCVPEGKMAKTGDPAIYVDFYSIYYDMVYGYASYQNWDVYGGPSFDGRGPKISEFNTVSISSCSSDKDMSWSLVKCMLSEEIQSKQENSNPINLNAFDKVATQAIDDANQMREKMYGTVRILDESDIEHYKKMLMKAESSSFVDSEIILIIDEEFQPYFEGDKTLDEVIQIIEARCQIVLDERQ